jgi:PKD repeat protein
MGDGTTYATQDITHTYQIEGLYTISLTVVDSTGTFTETKTNWVHALPETDTESLYPATHAPLAISNRSTNLLNELDATVEHLLDMDELLIAGELDGEPVTRANKVTIYHDPRRGPDGGTRRTIVVLPPGAQEHIIAMLRLRNFFFDAARNSLIGERPDGTLREWTSAAYSPAGGGGGGGSTGSNPITQNIAIANGAHDGVQLHTGAMELDHSSALNLTGPQRWGIFYFSGVNIATSGRVAEDVRLILTIEHLTDSIPGGMTIHSHKVINPSVPGTSDNYVSSLTPLTTGVVWAGGALGPGVHQSPNLASSFQQVIDLAGRSATFNVVVVVDCAGDSLLRARPFERVPSVAPVLKVTHVDA